jgi:hypothetical protein
MNRLTRREWLAAAALAGHAGRAISAPASASGGVRTLRGAFAYAETGIDPLEVSDG